MRFWQIRRCVTASFVLLGLLGGSFHTQAEEPAGTYQALGEAPGGKAYTGTVQIAPEGKAVHLAWQLDGGPGYLGLGLQLDDVLGAVYWPAKAKPTDLGVVIYRIDGGRLTGSWTTLPVPRHLVGREDLLGPASLEGRFEIAIGENPGGKSFYKGHVDISRKGDLYYFRWFTPGGGVVGSGIRMGDVMVVGYAAGRAPATVAYCVGGGELDGSWFGGEASDQQTWPLGREILRKDGAASADTTALKAPADCSHEMAALFP